ncbi:hypothetical protein EDD18DRAFT_1306901 [Armillaria luteobubalina]|uniref:N-acetyltransferase domain-containing protein n=1 Tax=Armillaria luteobubalina TaxID=153913 RepID=A0AA39QG71_9AGAR|nr:hypothetical protein EDD18DRAFT_1306901 [Armillaria luteobubalina]
MSLSLSLFPATQAQIIDARRRSFKEWGRSMTEEEYLRRDAEMDKDEHASNRKLTTWVLCSREDPESLEFKCSCETFLRRGLITIYRSKYPATAIASVFTPERYRRRGYAKHMMRLLHWVLAPPSSLPPTGVHPGHFSALWSDVGDFYRFCGPTDNIEGWVLRDASTTIWDVKPDAPADSISDEKWRLKQELIAKSAALDSGKTLLTFLPGDGVEMFQRIKSESFWGKLEPPVRHWGVISDDESAFATWTFERPPKTLLVTRLWVNQENFGDLVAVLKIEVWCLPDELKSVAQSHGAHLPALKWYGVESPTDVIWLNRERCVHLSRQRS